MQKVGDYVKNLIGGTKTPDLALDQKRLELNEEGKDSDYDIEATTYTDYNNEDVYDYEDDEDEDEEYSDEESEDSHFDDDPAVLLSVRSVTMFNDNCLRIEFENNDTIIASPIDSAMGDFITKADILETELLRIDHGSPLFCFTEGVRKKVTLPKTPRNVMQYAAAQGLAYKKFMAQRRFLYQFARENEDARTSSDATPESSDYYKSGDEGEEEEVPVEHLDGSSTLSLEQPLGTETETERRRRRISNPEDSGNESGVAPRSKKGRTIKQKIQEKYAFVRSRENLMFGKFPLPLAQVESAAMDLKRAQLGSFYLVTPEEWHVWTVMQSITVGEVMFMKAIESWYKKGENNVKYTKDLPMFLEDVFGYEEVKDDDDVDSDLPVEIIPLGTKPRSTGSSRSEPLYGQDIGLEATRIMANNLRLEYKRHFKQVSNLYAAMHAVCGQAQWLVREVDARYNDKKIPENPRVGKNELDNLRKGLEEMKKTMIDWNDFILVESEEGTW